jgi:hypothetical protein
MSFYSKIRGTLETIFQFGKGGPQIRDNAGVIEARNAADSDYVRVKVLAPVDDNDAVTKFYADSLAKPIIMRDQVDTSSSIPNNTAVRGFLLVTTAGSGAVIGDVLYDNGLNDASPMQILAAVEGRAIAITDAMSGGTISLDPDSIYLWDADGGSWVKIGDIGSVTGAVREIRYALDNTASQDSVSELPANAIISDAYVEIVTPYSGGGTIEAGDTVTSDKFMAQADIDPQTAGIYHVPQLTDQGGSASVVRATIGGAPAAGAGFLVIKYSNPNA